MEKCHFIHGICENKVKDTDDFGTKSLKSDMNIDMKMEQIDRTRRREVLKKYIGNRRYRPIRVRLVHYANRRFSIKKFQKVRIYRSLKVLPKKE